MGSTFNAQILVEKLAKLNNSQASIETLSHWCIFHMNKAKQVVETWDRQFHCSPHNQRLAFLYLANDILQNSRRKGSEFVGEFWNVLPDAVRDVIRNGDEFGRNAAQRLISIWEERKVFGSRGLILKEEVAGRHPDNYNRNGKHQGMKLKQPIGNTVDKIVLGYQVVYGGQVDEDVVLNKCRDAISSIEKVEKEIGTDMHSGQLHESAFVEELQGQHSKLKGCIEQLTFVESVRARLVSNLREAVQEQESKLAQIRNELQAAQSHSDQADNICRQLVNGNHAQLLAEQNSKEVHTSMEPPGFIPGSMEQSAPVMYARQMSFPEKSGQNEEDPRKSAAAAVAAKLTASTSSAQMLSYVLSSLASESVIGNSSKETSGDFPPEKRHKLENDQSYVPPQNPPPPPPIPPFTHPDSLQQNIITATPQLTPNDQPLPPPSSPPPMPPLPHISPYQMSPYLQNAPVTSSQFSSYNVTQQPPSVPGYPSVGAPVTGMSPFGTPPTNPYQSFQGSDGNLYSQPSSMPTALPISRQ